MEYLAIVFMGVTLGLLGGGGSILTVPILVYLFSVPVSSATGYSLLIVGVSALWGGWSYYRKKQIDFKIGLLFAIPAFIGVYLSRRYLVPLASDQFIMVFFAVIMLVASISMIKGRASSVEKRKDPNKPLILLEGLVVGGITGFVGAGGGFLIIPALVLLVGLDTKVAIGTSLMIIAIKSIFGFLGDLQVQAHIDWGLLATIISLSLVGVSVGSILSGRVNSKTLKPVFGVFVLLMGSVILFKQLF